ncbi:MAG: Transcriptional regulator, MerR family, partial [uncultured Rubrobacteraceae bacterium]
LLAHGRGVHLRDLRPPPRRAQGPGAVPARPRRHPLLPLHHPPPLVGRRGARRGRLRQHPANVL